MPVKIGSLQLPLASQGGGVCAQAVEDVQLQRASLQSGTWPPLSWPVA